MKKLILLLFIPLVFTCSSDESNSNDDATINCYGYLLEDNNDSILPSKITIVDADENNLTSVINYSYNGNKIVSRLQSISDNQGYINEIEVFFTYSENRVSSIDKYIDGVFSHTIQVEYNLQGIPSALIFDGNTVVEYTYQTDCLIFLNYPFNPDVDSMPQFVELDNNGNVSYAYRNKENDCVDSLTAEYDNYNNPFKNVTGHSNLGNILNLDSSIASNDMVHIFASLGLNNNPISHNSYSTQCNYTYNEVTTYSYDYNDAGYPVNVIISYDGAVYETVTIEYND